MQTIKKEENFHRGIFTSHQQNLLFLSFLPSTESALPADRAVLLLVAPILTFICFCAVETKLQYYSNQGRDGMGLVIRCWHADGPRVPEAPPRAEFLQKRLISAFFGFKWQNLAEILRLLPKVLQSENKAVIMITSPSYNICPQQMWLFEPLLTSRGSQLYKWTQH